ncbi:V-type ATPase subunit [Candidatus Woesearchaeota archaeon]|nr:V-type ATPase subunit [Candidatus Woesearchaeota archaeon]
MTNVGIARVGLLKRIGIGGVNHSLSKRRIRFSPYTYARVAVMKSTLLAKQDYDRLEKMGYYEVLRFLQDSSYKKEIDDHEVLAHGLKVVEQALNANLMRTFRKLHAISQGSLQELIALYLLRYDIANMKTVLRAKAAHIPTAHVTPLLYDSLNYAPAFWESVLSKETFEQTISALAPFKEMKIVSSDLFVLENVLDQYYIDRMVEFARSVRGEGRAILAFVEQEIETLNIKMLLRFVNDGNYDVTPHLLSPSYFIHTLAKIHSKSAFAAYLHRHKRTALTGDEPDYDVRLEIDLERSLLRKESLLMHRHLLSANYILGFMFAKEIEVRNLKIIVKGKKLAVAAKYVDQLVVS